MRLTPQEPEIPEVGGFTQTNDLFGYREFAERLANLVQNIEEPLVMALDGPWGSGKSVFVKQWAGLLRQRGAKVILFDAFQNDHYEDAFLALSAEIHATAKETLGGNEATTRQYFNKAKRAGIALAPMALRVAARAGTAGLLSLEDVEAGGEAVKAAARAIGDESERALERVISDRLRKSSEERAALETFREALSQVAGSLAEQRTHDSDAFPFVLIVDELDRCRPPFALSVIERIKHLFSVPGVCFVLVTHLPQLATAVQGAYGAKFDAQTYLEKFYHLRVLLPKPRNRPENQRANYINYLLRSLRIEFEGSGIGAPLLREVKDLAEIHDLTLRQIEHVMTNVALVGAATGPQFLVLSPLVAGLCVMRQTHRALYKKAKDGILTWDETIRFLQPAGENGVQDEGDINLWKYSIGAELPPEVKGRFERSLWNYRIDETDNLISLMASGLIGTKESD